MRIETFNYLAKSGIQVEWIIENLISPGGWTFLVGETGTGKSMMLIQLCDALQKGKDFLGFPTRQHNCLYIQADAGLIEWKKQVENLAGDSVAWTIHEISRGFLDIEARRKYFHDIVWGTYPEEHLLAPLLKHKPFNFVVFDCLHAITDGDLNTKTAMSNTLQHIDEIVTSDTGIREDGTRIVERVHYILVHHPNAQVKRGAIAGSGHKGFSDACSTKFTLGGNVLILEKSKLLGKKEIMLERDSDTGAWIVPSDSFSNYEAELDIPF